jgi:hypothetical protein
MLRGRQRDRPRAIARCHRRHPRSPGMAIVFSGPYQTREIHHVPDTDTRHRCNSRSLSDFFRQRIYAEHSARTNARRRRTCCLCGRVCRASAWPNRRQTGTSHRNNGAENRSILVGAKEGSRGNFPQSLPDRHLRALSDVFLGNSSGRHTASATRVFRAVPELRAAKGLPGGASSRSEAGCRSN